MNSRMQAKAGGEKQEESEHESGETGASARSTTSSPHVSGNNRENHSASGAVLLHEGRRIWSGKLRGGEFLHFSEKDTLTIHDIPIHPKPTHSAASTLRHLAHWDW